MVEVLDLIMVSGAIITIMVLALLLWDSLPPKGSCDD